MELFPLLREVTTNLIWRPERLYISNQDRTLAFDMARAMFDDSLSSVGNFYYSRFRIQLRFAGEKRAVSHSDWIGISLGEWLSPSQLRHVYLCAAHANAGNMQRVSPGNLTRHHEDNPAARPVPFRLIYLLSTGVTAIKHSHIHGVSVFPFSRIPGAALRAHRALQVVKPTRGMRHSRNAEKNASRNIFEVLVINYILFSRCLHIIQFRQITMDLYSTN